MSELFMGVDVSKGYADFVIMDVGKTVIEPCFRLDDTANGHAALKRVIANLTVKAPDATIYAAVESTGGFENNWLEMLRNSAVQFPLKSARINPCPVGHYLDAEMKRTRTDEVSAWGIAGFMIAHRDKVLYDQDDQFYSVRKQWTTLRLLNKQRTQLLNQLHTYIYSANPGVLIYCRRGIPGWLLKVLYKWPTAPLLANARVTAVASIAYVKEEKAQALIRYAKDDVASQTDETTIFTMRQILSQIRMVTKAIENIEQALCNNWEKHPSVQMLRSFKGIGTMSALGLLINIRDHKLFPDAAHLASYFGLHPVYRQSGDGVFGFHMSKEGRSEPRAILFMVALSAIVYNPTIRDLYKRLLKDPKRKRLDAIGICMHKIIRIVYGMLKNNTAFDPKVDEKNRSKSGSDFKKQEEIHQQQSEGKARRYQACDTKAPISGRQAKNRKKGNVIFIRVPPE